MGEIQKICPFCGNEIKGEVTTCPYCDEKIKNCPKCGQYIPERDMYCQNCGQDDTGDTGQQSVTRKQMVTVLLMILVIGLGVGVVLAARRGHGDGEVPDTSQQPSLTTGESSVPESSENAANDVGGAYAQMLSEGRYTEVLETILTLDSTELGTDEKGALADALSQAMAGQYAQFEEQVSSLQNAEDYDGALAAVDEEARLYDQLMDNAFTQQYADGSWTLAEKRVGIMKAHADYLLNLGQSDGVLQWDEAMLNSSILDRLQGYVDEGILSQEEFDREKAVIYGKFINSKIAFMGNEGTDAETIVAFIVEKIADTGYNCQTLEYWDFYMSVMGKGAGDPSLVNTKSSTGYLLPGSDSEKLNMTDISGFSRDELRLAIYEIFARHGYVFQDSAVNAYFKNQGWYRADASFKGDNLNEYERSNLAMLVSVMFGRYL